MNRQQSSLTQREAESKSDEVAGPHLYRVAHTFRINPGHRVLGDSDDSTLSQPYIRHDPVHKWTAGAFEEDEKIVGDFSRHIAVSCGFHVTLDRGQIHFGLGHLDTIESLERLHERVLISGVSLRQLFGAANFSRGLEPIMQKLKRFVPASLSYSAVVSNKKRGQTRIGFFRLCSARTCCHERHENNGQDKIPSGDHRVSFFFS